MVGIIGAVFYIIYNYNLELFNFRGSIWYFSFMGFCDGTLWQKLLGVGPALLDTVTQAQIAKADFYVEWNWLYCTAHNDLLEYLVTMGVFGAACKLLMYILPFVMYARGKERKPEKAAVLAALVGYRGAGLVYRTLYSDLCTLHYFPGCAGRILSHGKRKRSRSMSIRQYWFVLWELTKRELKRKYARSFLGILWSCVYPLMRMALVVVLFSTIFNKGIDKYPAYYFVGFLMFEFFATATQTSLTTLKDNRNLLIKSNSHGNCLYCRVCLRHL